MSGNDVKYLPDMQIRYYIKIANKKKQASSLKKLKAYLRVVDFIGDICNMPRNMPSDISMTAD